MRYETPFLSSYIKPMAQAAYGKGEKADMASEAFLVGSKFMEIIPIGCSFDERNSNILRQNLIAHMKANYNPEPKGFFLLPIIGVWWIQAILSGILSWVAEKLMQLYFPHLFEEQK